MEMCENHHEPLKLFCKDHESLICLVCDRATEHRGHNVVPAEEAAPGYKEEIEGHRKSVELMRKNLEDRVLAEELGSQECLAKLEAETMKVKSSFHRMSRLLEKMVHLKLTQKEELKREINKRQQENVSRLSKEISRLNDMIVEMEEKCQQPVCGFLQDIRSDLSRYEKEQVRDAIELSPGLEEAVGVYSDCSSALGIAVETFKESLEFLEPALYKVMVTLDPDTAHRRLILSEDLKTVRKAEEDQTLPDKPGRFDVGPCVLGRERFTSGRHLWEVEVENEGTGAMWAVGVARESVRRKGKGSFRLIPSEGIWAVGAIMGELVAFTSPKQTPLALGQDPRNIRVTLDYEEGLVEFFDTDRDELIFSFTGASFSGQKIRPYFWVGYRSQLRC
ncbi:zinc finger protein RFP-like [Zootoca vivipara]|uniref:zinc finger protein RFP-like n=1 Tax=Zootoca vivipara TaxID=8524 RepID=UPI00293BF7A6|nr:zinc finger protein RFP-like [Zootoca vivipara]